MVFARSRRSVRVGPVAQMDLAGRQTRLDRVWPADRRRPFEIALLVGLLLFSAFDAFEDEHKARIAAESALDGANKDAVFWKGRAKASSTPIPSASSTKPSHERLSRLIAYLSVAPDLSQSGRDTILRGFEVQVANVGSDQIRLKWYNQTLSVDGHRLPVVCDGTDWIYLPQTQNHILRCNLRGGSISPSLSARNITAVSTVVYDTVPTTGLRTSMREVSIPLNLDRSQSGPIYSMDPDIRRETEK